MGKEEERMKDRRQRWIRHALGAVAALALATGVAACGGDDDEASTASSSNGGGGADSALSAETKATFEEFSKPMEWPGPEEAVAAPEKKKLTVVICGSQGITCVRVGNGVKAAGEALGYDVKIVDGRSQPQVWNQAVQAAVADKTDGIVLAAVPPALVADAMGKAKEAKIPVAAVLSVAGPPADVGVEIDRPEVARANSAWIANDSGGKANVLVVRDDEFPETKVTSDAYKTELAKACKDCKIADEISFTLALASQRLASDTAQALQKNPDIDYIVLPFDTVTTFVSQGVREAGKTGKVKIIGLGGDPPSIEAIKAGDMAQSFGQQAEWMGWNAVDGLTRIFAGEEVPPIDEATHSNYEVTGRYVTKDNLPEGDHWDGDFDYPSKYKELWGK